MVNKAIIIGRLGKAPETRQLDGGNTVVNFTVATSEKYKDRTGQQQEVTEWHQVVAWGKLAEVCGKYLHKGSLVYVEGKMTRREWEDKEGNKRYSHEIVAHTMQMLGGKTEQANQEQAKPEQPARERYIGDDGEDELPF